MSTTVEATIPTLRREHTAGYYPWLAGHPKAGTPPTGTPKRVEDVEARLAAKYQGCAMPGEGLQESQ